MFDGRLIIVDLTTVAPRFAVVADSSCVFDILDLSPMISRVILMVEGGSLVMRASEDASSSVIEDNHALVIEQALDALPRIEDAELQSHLMRAVWRNLCEGMERRDQVGFASRAVCYIIPPRNYPPSLLERWRQLCTDDRRIKLAGFIHETASLAMGFLQSSLFNQVVADIDLSSPATIGLIIGEADSVEAVCFDYKSRPSGQFRILIRDHLHTGYAAFQSRLKLSDWLSSISTLVLLTGPGSLEDFGEVSGLIDSGVDCRNLWTSDLPLLKLQGAAHIACFCIGQGELSCEFVFETAYHIGLRINQHHLYPILRKEEAIWISDFPHIATQTFKLSGQPGNEWRFGLYCGYSELIVESTLLGYCSLKQPELSKLAASDSFALVAAVRLDKSGAGELTLELLPDDVIVGLLSFTLPGLVL